MSYSKNGFLATGTGGGSSTGPASIVNTTTTSIPPPYGTGNTWVLGGVANNPDTNTLNVTTAVNSVNGWAWYPTTQNLDGLYLAFDAVLSVDTVQILLGDPASDTTTSNPFAGGNHGIVISFESYYQATRPAPDAAFLGGYCQITWGGSTNPLTTSAAMHVNDSTLNWSGSGQTYGPFRVELFVRATGVSGVYHYQLFKNGSPYLDTLLPGPATGKVLVGLAGNTGGANGITKITKFAGYQNLYEAQPVSTTGVYASPSLARPQGTQQRQYTFDSDTNGFTTDTGSLTTVFQRLQVTSAGNANSSVLEPSSAASVPDGELWADIYPNSPDSGGLYDFGLIFRATDANNHYMMALHQGTSSTSPEFQLYKKVSGSYISLAASPTGSSTINAPLVLPVATQSRVMVRFAGPSISLYYNETFVLAYYDSTYTTGRIGVRAAGATGGNVIQFDNVTVTTLTANWNPLLYTTQTGATYNNLEVVNVANSGTAYTIPDVSVATLHRITLTGNVTFTFPIAVAGKSFTLNLVQDATGSRTVTFPTVKWAGGLTPTMTATATKEDVYTFTCVDGTNWLAFNAGQNF